MCDVFPDSLFSRVMGGGTMTNPRYDFLSHPLSQKTFHPLPVTHIFPSLLFLSASLRQVRLPVRESRQLILKVGIRKAGTPPSSS